MKNGSQELSSDKYKTFYNAFLEYKKIEYEIEKVKQMIKRFDNKYNAELNKDKKTGVSALEEICIEYGYKGDISNSSWYNAFKEIALTKPIESITKEEILKKISNAPLTYTIGETKAFQNARDEI